jgi:sporulation protein YlmC with PRC-barrel domain
VHPGVDLHGSTTIRRFIPMKRSLTALAAGALLASSAAFVVSAAQADVMTTVPSSSLTVTDWYKQDVYDQTNTKIGQVMDVLVGQDGQVNALIIGVGGFLGAGEKDVAVSFNTVKATMKDNKIYLTMNTTKDALKSAPGFKYDSNKTAWVPDPSSR